MKRFLVILLGLVAAFFLLKNEDRSPMKAKSPLLKGAHPPLHREASLGLPSLSDLITKPLSLTPFAKGVKVLFNSREREAEEERLMDRRNIDEATEALTRVFSRLDPREERGRMAAVDFLINALVNPANHDRDYVIGAVSEAILSESLYQTEDLNYRKSLVGDKVELYEALSLTDPSAARELYRQHSGGALSKVLYFAKGRAEFHAQMANR